MAASSTSVAQPTVERWSVALPGALAAQAARVAGEVAKRLADPARVQAVAATAMRQTVFPNGVRWVPHDVAQGDAGLALLCGQLDRCFPGNGWDVAAHAYLSRAAGSAEQTMLRRPALFGGLSGLAFTTWSLSKDGARYQRLLSTLDESLVVEIMQGRINSRTPPHGMPVHDFDVISGLAGLGGYLLCRRHNPSAGEALAAVLTRLVALCGEHDGLPHWHTPYEAMADGEWMAREFPGGNLNCGLAHGIPGPLAVLSLALYLGVAVVGQHEAIERSAEWLITNRADDQWGVNWSAAVALPSTSETPPIPGRSAWCYGSPGVARALWLAGQALNDSSLRTIATDAMTATFRRPRWQRGIDSPGFCHGVAGLLQITLRFANDTGDPLFAEAAKDLTDQLLGLYAPERPLGYYTIEPGGNYVDQPGLLDGAAGVALVLLAGATDIYPAWDRLFLLA